MYVFLRNTRSINNRNKQIDKNHYINDSFIPVSEKKNLKQYYKDQDHKVFILFEKDFIQGHSRVKNTNHHARVKNTNHHMTSLDLVKMNSWCKFGECSSTPIGTVDKT